jgi:hypothetical protein
MYWRIEARKQLRIAEMKEKVIPKNIFDRKIRWILHVFNPYVYFQDTGMPDFSLFNKPKRGENIPNYHEITKCP